MKNIFVILSVILASAVFAQSCPTAMDLCYKKKEDKPWAYNGQSKSGRLEANKEYTMSFVAYKGLEYKLRIGTHLEDMQGKVEFEVYEMVNKKVQTGGKLAYEKEKKVLIKNADMEYINEVKFSSTKTKKLYIKVKVIAEGGDADSAYEDTTDPENKKFYYCIGVLILQQKSIKTGF